MKILGRELKPCPFCGKMNPQITFEVTSDAGGQPFVKYLSVSCCANVDIEAPIYYEYDRAHISGSDALDMWNSRTSKAARWVQGHCSNCGCSAPGKYTSYTSETGELVQVESRFCPSCGFTMINAKKGDEIK